MSASDEVVLSLTDSGGVSNAISGWTDVRITRGIERMPSDFQISMSEVFPGIEQIIARPGMGCALDIGADRVVTGYVDRVVIGLGPQQHPITIVGRGRCQDLVDCSAVWQGGQFMNQTVFQIAQAVAAPFGIDVVCEEPGDPFPQVCMTPGETPFSLISRLCRVRGLLCYEDENGDLVLCRVGSDGAAGGLQQGINIESASLTMAMDQRFSDYTVIQQGAAFLSDALGNQSLDLYTVKDGQVPRFRPKYIPVENEDANQAVAMLRAQWEANRRLGRGYALSVTNDSWRDLDGDLWYPNTVVPLSVPTLKVDGQSWLIGEITYSAGMGGKRCELTIMPPQAFDIEPILYVPVPADVVQALN